MATLHTLLRALDEYPRLHELSDAESAKEFIGGNVNDDWITNTCAIRLSRALNYNGILVQVISPVCIR